MRTLATIAAAEAVKAIERLGGSVTWPEAQDLTLTASVTVGIDPEDVASQLAERGCLDGEIELADPGDVRDFVAACGRGDLMIAGALAPRLFASDANIAAIERGLCERRAV